VTENNDNDGVVFYFFINYLRILFYESLCSEKRRINVEIFIFL